LAAAQQMLFDVLFSMAVIIPSPGALLSRGERLRSNQRLGFLSHQFPIVVSRQWISWHMHLQSDITALLSIDFLDVAFL
jgi:hypothetical protein